ncbi:hypothetical protein C943_02884 [Mariniradius saccharolyticus AK6]|uniref:Uncharacterized protein n=1 Tax=Mariniradius saccharolyticus AK6 TaxID=1239962 RepID=M7XKE8_9BACT|nr:hypothetical protein C943_02884 [Mariniradius saccharolyticus AK6]
MLFSSIPFFFNHKRGKRKQMNFDDSGLLFLLWFYHLL